MAYSFENRDWAAEIADITTQPQYQTATIRILDESLVTSSWNIETDETVYTGDPLIYQGRARIIPVRSGIYQQGTNQSNATTIQQIRVQIPSNNQEVIAEFGYGEAGYGIDPYGGVEYTAERVRRGCKIFVDAAPFNPTLTDFIFNVSSDTQGSSMASRTITASLDLDVKKDG